MLLNTSPGASGRGSGFQGSETFLTGGAGASHHYNSITIVASPIRCSSTIPGFRLLLLPREPEQRDYDKFNL